MICSANQLTGFCMMATLVFNELRYDSFEQVPIHGLFSRLNHPHPIWLLDVQSNQCNIRLCNVLETFTVNDKESRMVSIYLPRHLTIRLKEFL